MEWKAGDWAVLDMDVGQIKELRDDGMATFSDGFFEISGKLVERFRPLTLRNKRIVEAFDYCYKRLNEIDGEAGFNYPDISQHFASLALSAIDAEGDAEKQFHDQAGEFIREARDHLSIIQGVGLFRRNLRRA